MVNVHRNGIIEPLGNGSSFKIVVVSGAGILDYNA